jgi:2-iminobutanoate/2-iminopropanoate deaminase
VPQPAGPYSPSIRIGSIAVCAGQGARSPDGLMAEGIEAQTRQTLDNVVAALGAVGATADDVAQVRVYLTDTEHFAAMNEVYRSYFDEPFPARTTVYVMLPAGLLIEVDALAVLG